MFTGLIEEVGRVRAVRPRAGGLDLEVDAPAVSTRLAAGDSIAVQGVCLTVREARGESFRADVIAETRRSTYLERLRAGDPVNLERALRADGRLGGHIVQGHIDGVGVVATLRPSGGGKVMEVRCDPSLGRHFVEKGSVALDGVSLTIASVDRERIRVALVPATLERSAFGAKGRGDPVHVEGDIVGKYIEKYARSAGRGGALRRGGSA